MRAKVEEMLHLQRGGVGYQKKEDREKSKAEQRLQRLAAKRERLVQLQRELEDTRMEWKAQQSQLTQLESQLGAAREELSAAQTRVATAHKWLQDRVSMDPYQADLRAKKQELVSQLMGLLPVFPTPRNTLRVVNFEIPLEEAYETMADDESAAIVGYFVKLSSLLGRYLEISVPNVVSLSPEFRWMIRARGSPVTGQDMDPVPLHPRTAGIDAFRIALSLLQQNVVRLCFDQGITVRPGCESKIAQNIHLLVSHVEPNPNLRIGLGWEGPFPTRVTLPEERLSEEDFVLVPSGE